MTRAHAKPHRPLTLAVPKGRILEDLQPLCHRVGIDLSPFLDDSRKLLVDSPDGTLRLILLRSSDVPTYVSYGVADLGICGSDILIEDGADLVEPLDLELAKCRLAVAAPKDSAHRYGSQQSITVATKYPNITRRFFRRKGMEAIIVKLYGSVELACIAGLADVVVDLVSTGGTLKANNLVELETLMEVSSRLVVNRASLKTRCDEVNQLLDALREGMEEQS